jgi:glycosyltransferase involved in cell wall biosynthesis
MRILQILNTLGAGGAEQYVAQLSSYLTEQGDDVVVVASEPFTISGRFPSSAKLVSMELHPGYGKPAYRYFIKILPNIMSLYRLIRREKIQVVHTHLAASALPAWIAAKAAGVPVVHSKMHTEAIASGFERVLFASPLPRFLVSRFLAFSVYATVEIKQIWRANEDRIMHSSIGVDAAFYDPAHFPEHTARSLFSLPENTLVIGVLARLFPEKNVDLVMASFAQMKNRNAVLLIGGDGPERESLERMARDMGVADRACFLGQQADPRPVYAAADVVMQTTRGPNMGMMALEALSMGTPLLIAARDDDEIEMAKDTLGGYDIGWIVSADPVAMGQVLDELASDRKQLKEKRQMARHYVLECHDRRHAQAELRKAYQQLVEPSTLS